MEQTSTMITKVSIYETKQQTGQQQNNITRYYI